MGIIETGVKAGVKAGAKAAAKGSVKASVETGVKTGAEKVAEQAARTGARELSEVAARESGKVSVLRQWGNLWVNNPMKATKMHLGIGFTTAVAGGVVSGQGAFKGAQFFLGGWKGTKEGGVQTANRWLNGDDKAEKHNILGATTDSFVGDGTTDQLAEAVGTARDGIKHGFEATRDQIASLGNQVREKFEGNQHPQQQQYPSSMTEEQRMEAEMQQYLRYAGYPLNQEADYGSLGNGGFFDGASNFLSNLFGNKNATMGSAAVAAAAWVLFGRFGWLTKVAGVLGGYWGLGKMKDGLYENYLNSRGKARVSYGRQDYVVPQRVPSAGQNFDQIYGSQQHQESNQDKIVFRGV